MSRLSVEFWLIQDLIRKQQQEQEGKQKMQAVRAWLEQVVGEPLKSDDLEESIKDGTVLCRTINGLHPNAIKKFHQNPKMPAMCMENLGKCTCFSTTFLSPSSCLAPRPSSFLVTHSFCSFVLAFRLSNSILETFLKSCSSLYRIPQASLFHPSDLYNGENITKVVGALFDLSKKAVGGSTTPR